MWKLRCLRGHRALPSGVKGLPLWCWEVIEWLCILLFIDTFLSVPFLEACHFSVPSEQPPTFLEPNSSPSGFCQTRPSYKLLAHASPSPGRRPEAPGVWTQAGAGEPVRTAFCSSPCSIDPIPRLLVNSARVWCKLPAAGGVTKQFVLNLNGGHEAQFSSGRLGSLVFYFNTLIKHHCFPTHSSDLGILFLLYNIFELA